MKIQYFSSDLSAALDIGQINEMHIELLNGVPVLRIDCQDKPLYEYKTIKVTKTPASKKRVVLQPLLSSIKTAKDQPPAPQTRDKDLEGKLIDIGKKFMSNKEKPNFMKDAGF
jgi:hypothetical protein